jgi:hypothetical protein
MKIDLFYDMISLFLVSGAAGGGGALFRPKQKQVQTREAKVEAGKEVASI